MTVPWGTSSHNFGTTDVSVLIGFSFNGKRFIRSNYEYRLRYSYILGTVPSTFIHNLIVFT